MQSVGQKKTKTFREHCNATIIRVLNTSGANYKINLNRELEISYQSFTLSLTPTLELDFLVIR